MNVSIESATMPTPQVSPNSSRAGVASDGGASGRRFEDCLAEISAPGRSRVPHERARGRSSDDESSRDVARDQARERARRGAAEGSAIGPQQHAPVTRAAHEPKPVRSEAGTSVESTTGSTDSVATGGPDGLKADGVAAGVDASDAG